MKRIWSYGTSTPVQRIGVIILSIGIFSLFSWMVKEDLAFYDLFEQYYLPSFRDSLFFHLFFYLIPVGLAMSWGYQILITLKDWIFNEKPKELKQENEQKQLYASRQKNLHFKNNLAAFDFASSIYSLDLSIGKNFFGIVREKCAPNNEEVFFIIELAGSKEPIFVTGLNTKYSDLINIGNIIYWGLDEYFGEKRILDVQAKGFILAILSPEFNPNNKQWNVRNNLTK